MSDRQGKGLQFETAASPNGGGTVSCGTCQRTIPDVYYEAGGQVLCAVCKDAAQDSLQGGSRVGRLLSALAFGTIAAAVSAVGWYAITELTGYELGIVAIAVGILVGAAVRAGAKGRGGWLYQTLAVAFTYLAIATSYVPTMVEVLRAQALQESEVAQEEEPTAEQVELVQPSGEETPGASPDEVELPPEAQEAAIWVGAIVFAFTWPVLQVTEGGFIGLLIVGFALYEAWKLNRRQALALTGPFRVESGSGAAAV